MAASGARGRAKVDRPSPSAPASVGNRVKFGNPDAAFGNAVLYRRLRRGYRAIPSLSITRSLASPLSRSPT